MTGPLREFAVVQPRVARGTAFICDVASIWKQFLGGGAFRQSANGVADSRWEEWGPWRTTAPGRFRRDRRTRMEWQRAYVILPALRSTLNKVTLYAVPSGA
jgi:hypothetical protein